MMKCSKCNSEKIEAIDQFPSANYAEMGEYVVTYKCRECGFEFMQTYTAEEPMFEEERLR
ncbi:unnamed protein product [marine sediment metagenome]|uniref:Uncharacterized protein n=1 Tax=marine sediment metagenome TaxID=412755 RepID=X1T3H5_9ZZZZ